MSKNAVSALAKDLIEALHEVHDDVTGRVRLFRYPTRMRMTSDLSGVLTIDEWDNFAVRLELQASPFARCVVQ